MKTTYSYEIPLDVAYDLLVEEKLKWLLKDISNTYSITVNNYSVKTWLDEDENNLVAEVKDWLKTPLTDVTGTFLYSNNETNTTVTMIRELCPKGDTPTICVIGKPYVTPEILKSINIETTPYIAGRFVAISGLAASIINLITGHSIEAGVLAACTLLVAFITLWYEGFNKR